MPVLLTRPIEQSRKTAALLAGDGIRSLIWPLTRIVPVGRTVEIGPEIGGLLFTSSNGVAALAEATDRRDLPALCVGDSTAASAREAGFGDVRSAAGDARALADLARDAGIRHFLNARGAHTTGDLAARLASDGVAVTEAVLYRADETGPPPADTALALDAGTVELVTVWSPRAAEILARRLSGTQAGQCDCLAISAAAAVPVAQTGFRSVKTAESPSGHAMLVGIRRYFGVNQG